MILVTGATGTVGRPLTDLLLGEGAKVHAVTRDPRAAELPAGVEIVAADPARPDTVAPFLEGVTALFLNPRAVGTAAPELLALAKTQGARRVVALSAINVDDELDHKPSRFRGDRNRKVEDAAIAGGFGVGEPAVQLLRHQQPPGVGQPDPRRRRGARPYRRFSEAPIDERDLARSAPARCSPTS